METVYIGLIFFLICIAYGYATCIYKKEDLVIEVDAGSDKQTLFKCYKPNTAIKLSDGFFKNSSQFIRIIISGNDFSHRDIKDGEEFLVEKIDKNTKITNRDVILIQQSDTYYFIAEFVNYISDHSVKVIHFGVEEIYNLNQVMGIVKYSIKY